MKALPGALYVGALRGAAAEGHRKARAMLSVRRQQVFRKAPLIYGYTRLPWGNTSWRSPFWHWRSKRA